MEQPETAPLVLDVAAATDLSAAAAAFRLEVTLDLAAGCIRFEWFQPPANECVARGELAPTEQVLFAWFSLDWKLEVVGQRQPELEHLSPHGSSTNAFVRRLQKRFPVTDHDIHAAIVSPCDTASMRAGQRCGIKLPPTPPPWKWVTREIQDLSKTVVAARATAGNSAATLRQHVIAVFARSRLPLSDADFNRLLGAAPTSSLVLRITLEMVQGFIQLDWSDARSNQFAARGQIRLVNRDTLAWELDLPDDREVERTTKHRNSIRAALNRWRARFPVATPSVSAVVVSKQANQRPLVAEQLPFTDDEPPWPWLEDNILRMAVDQRFQFSPLGKVMADPRFAVTDDNDAFMRKLREDQERDGERQARIEANAARIREQERQKALARQQRHAAEQKKSATEKQPVETKASRAKAALQEKEMAPQPPAPPPTPVVVRIELPALEFQDTMLPLADWRHYLLRERAALWWVSNQSDDLLCLPHCRIQRLEYQIRSALRVLGPLRGRALLSDEVGLGKTIEAGLVLKELLTRGMVKKFLVLTVPSLVDQWEEELADKFGLTAATTNQSVARADIAGFWGGSTGIVASLHTLKQPAQLAVAREITWDLIVVDEAHYLRNRDSQAWQAVSALRCQFLLLLTATPVQNSLEELYNLVTLLQPGQLPSPKEFRARFLDPKRPRQPREPEALRELLGQVMIRNTRANAGLDLPPRRAETVVFEPAEDERAFWLEWEAEFRLELARLPASQTSLWGRLLLQAAGSSPAAWRQALEKFPAPGAARRWRERAPLEESWRKKCDLLMPLTRGDGGVVIFTQFLETQAALAEALRMAGAPTFLVNGQTPPAARQPITEEFRKAGGALLLTHSGTEGRNLQFSHRLVNFDLPWNPMEIEQRIGRLHRLGQKQPVRIYNLVQAGTLQEHLLTILQEKLNLFELVVGETGLVLGERFSSDEFAEEVFRRWRDGDGRVAESLQSLGEELAAARQTYAEVKQLDETLFAHDYESL